MKNRLFIFLVFSLSLYNVHGQITFHLSTENTLDLTVRPCTTARRDAAIGSGAGYLEISDINGQVLSSETGISEFSIRPYNFKVTPASCRYIEGPNRGKTFTLGGGYTITIDPTFDSYYEKRNNGALYFEEINTSVLYELNCNTNSINASNAIVDMDVVEWEYRFEGNTEVLANSQNKASLPIDFENFKIDLTANNNKLIDFRYRLNGNVYSPWRTYTIVICSPELVGDPTKTDATCFGYNDGSVTLTFDRNVDVDGGFQMRYYVYDSDASIGFDPETQSAPSSQEEIILDALVPLNDGSGYYSGKLPIGIGEGDYKIVYQEVNYKADPVEVKSGAITPVFTIGQPSQVTLNIADSNFFTDASCGNPAIFQMNGTASGGDNLDSAGTYSYEYSMDNEITWRSVTDPNNVLEISSTTTNQSVKLRGVYNVSGNSCGGEIYSYSISATENPILFSSNPEIANTSTSTANDGSVRIEFSGSGTSFMYNLNRLNTETNNYESVNEATSEQFIIPGGRAVRFNTLFRGTYRVTVTDANGCPQNSPDLVVSTDPVPTLGTPVISQITCVGGAGSISVPISDFNTSYRYQWFINDIASPIANNGEKNVVLNNITDTGTYVLRVASARVSNDDFTVNTNVKIATIVMNDPPLVTIDDAISIGASCNNNTDGSIQLVLSGGTNYEYALGNSSTSWFTLTANTISNLSAGNYTVIVRNENGCESAPSASIFIDEPDVLSVSEITGQRKNATTNGGKDGEISIEITGGTMPYSYEWSGPNGFTSDQQNIVGITAGNYQVVVTDANNCSENLGPINITEPGPLGITSLIANDVFCKGDATGSIIAEVSGTPPFTFVWTKDGDPSFSAPNQSDIGGLSEGTYTLELSDASGDPSVSETVFVAEPLEALVGEIIATDASCFNGNDGEITINTSGGTAPYQYAIDDGFGFQDSNVFANLSPRTYAVSIRDANGCLFEGNIAVSQPDAIDIDVANTIITDATTTGGSDGAIVLEILGGTGSYFYEWNGPNVNGNTSKDLTGLVAGTYQVTVTDTNGCTFNEEIVVSEPGPLSINNIQEFNVACNGEASGRITSTVTGNGNITFEWRNVATNTIISTIGEDLENIPAGIYTLTIADDTANPPVTSRQITISEPEIFSAEVIPSEVTCFGGNDGVIQVNPVGGTPPYRYSIDGANFQNNNQFNGLFAGSYEVTILDSNDCQLMTNGVVAQPQELGIIVDEVKNLTAANTADGGITITVFGGTAPYSYEWVSSNGFTSTDEDINGLEGGTYTLVIRDANNISNSDGCYFTQEFIIAEPGELIVTLSQSVFLECYGDDFAELIATVQGGVTPYAYQWFTLQNGSNALLPENSGIIGDLSAGDYFVRVTDANSIVVNTAPFTIIEPDLLEINLDDKVDLLCAAEATGSIAITVNGGTAPYQFYWDNGETMEDLSGLISGDYVLEVVDANGCFAERTINIAEPNDALRIANATVTDVSEYQGNDGGINLEVVGGNGSYNILWTRLSDNANIGNETSLTGLSADNYQVTITDVNGCAIIENYEISQPDIVEETLVPPTCAGASDGSISILVNKGNGVFNYSWSTGETTNNISGLTAGTYTVTIDGFGDGPITRTYMLEDPIPLNVDLGEDRVLCEGQQVKFDVTVPDATASYFWTSDNGFESNEPEVVLTEKGNYTVVVESQSGCTAQGAIFIDVSAEEISAEFAMSSQVFVGEPLILVDISYPLPDSIEWLFPEGALVVKADGDEAELVFTNPGTYEIGIITYRGSCTAQQTKKVMILAKDGTVNEEEVEFNEKIVEDFVLFPNPTAGQFNAQINLSERGNVSVKVFSFSNNALIASEKARGESSYNVSMDISGKPAGVYAVVLETPYGTSLRKIILK